MKEILEKLMAHGDLTEAEMATSMSDIMSGTVSDARLAAFLVALRMKGETVAEISGAAKIMREKAVRIDAMAQTVLDTCGTGGDSLSTFNISTATAFVAAAGGVTVAKHGNRAVSSRCGSADVLSELGVNIEADHTVVEEAVQTIGIGFLFAPKLHPAMKYAISVRKDLGVRSVFNMLGPLTNPAGATNQLLGVFAPELTEVYARVLKSLGTRRALVVHGMDGLDEASVSAENRVSELQDGMVQTYVLNPLDYFPDLIDPAAIAGGTPAENAAVIREVFGGARNEARQVVVFNAALAFYVTGRCQSVRDGISEAEQLLDQGAVQTKLAELIELSNR